MDKKKKNLKKIYFYVFAGNADKDLHYIWVETYDTNENTTVSWSKWDILYGGLKQQ